MTAEGFDTVDNNTSPFLSQQKITPSGCSHSFDTGIAEQLGVQTAIVYNHIVFWLKNNFKKNVNRKGGKTWMYETMAQMADVFGYLNERQVRYAISRLVQAGVLIEGNFNKNKYDRTSWYALADETPLGVSKKDDSATNLSQDKANLNNASDNFDASHIRDIETSIDDGESKGSSKGREENRILKDDVYSFALRLKKDWTTDEIEAAYLALKSAAAPISDPYAYIESIINNKRVQIKNKQHQNQKDTTCRKKNTKPDRYPQPKEESKPNKEECTEKDTPVQILGRFDYR